MVVGLLDVNTPPGCCFLERSFPILWVSTALPRSAPPPPPSLLTPRLPRPVWPTEGLPHLEGHFFACWMLAVCPEGVAYPSRASVSFSWEVVESHGADSHEVLRLRLADGKCSMDVRDHGQWVFPASVRPVTGSSLRTHNSPEVGARQGREPGSNPGGLPGRRPVTRDTAHSRSGRS